MREFEQLPKKNRTVSTTDVLILPQRRCGNTTRIIDKVIQDLFAGKLCRICDHYPSERSSRDLFIRVMQRIEIEHRYIYDNVLCVNKEMYCMWLDLEPINKLKEG